MKQRSWWRHTAIVVFSVAANFSGAQAASVEAGLGTSVYLESEGRNQNLGWVEYQRDAWQINWTGRIDQQWRYGESDQLWSLSAARPFTPRWTLAGQVAGSTDSADLYPRRVLELTPYYRVTDGWLASLTLRQSRYPADQSLTAIPTIEVYLGNYRFAYSAFLTQVTRNVATSRATVDPLALASSLSVDRYYRYSSRIGASLSVGTERDWNNTTGTLSSATQVGVTVDGLHGWSPTWATRWLIQARDHDRLGLQGEVRLGLRYRY